MNKNQILQSYFDKSKLLTIDNPKYQKQVETLSKFFLMSDEIESDASTNLISKFLHDTSRHLDPDVTSGERSRPVKRLEISHPIDTGFEMTKASKAVIIAKQNGIVAGIEESLFIINMQSSIHVDNRMTDGDKVIKGDVIFKLHGKFEQMLTLERTVLNVIQRMSGIATETNRLISHIDSKTRVAATRKTLWGWLDKKAVTVGGGLTHRLSLSDGILIKDNHVDVLALSKKVGSRNKAIETILTSFWQAEGAPRISDSVESGQARVTMFEIEVISYEEAMFVVKLWNKINQSKPLIIMLDNFSLADAKKTVSAIKNKNVIIELSGGINAGNIKEYGKIGADVISLGSLTHSSNSFDMSLTIV